jgi:hypothetical protein
MMMHFSYSHSRMSCPAKQGKTQEGRHGQRSNKKGLSGKEMMIKKKESLELNYCFEEEQRE